MGILGDIFKVVIDVAEIPVAVVKDVITLGGTCTMEEKPYTAQKLEELKKDLTEL